MTYAPASSLEPSSRPLWWLTAASLALSAALLPLIFLDSRLVEGVPTWLKPFKFSLSFVAYLGTLAVLQGRLSPDWADSSTLRVTVRVIAVALAAEMAYLLLQAARARPSHFNDSTTFESTMYALMGVGAVSLVAALGVFAYAAGRDRAARLTPGVRWGFVLGLGLSFVLTMIVANVMASGPSRWVGTPTPGGPTIPLLGWSAEVGDLRPAHFLSLHAMQALPLLGLLADRVIPQRARLVTATGALIWTALTAAVFAQAMAGLPLVRL